VPHPSSTAERTESSARHADALARASALAICTSATAAGVPGFEPSPQVLDATAGLSAALAFDLWIDVQS